MCLGFNQVSEIATRSGECSSMADHRLSILFGRPCMLMVRTIRPLSGLVGCAEIGDEVSGRLGGVVGLEWVC